MKTQPELHSQPELPPPKVPTLRIIALTGAIAITLGGATIWVLSIENLIAGSWSTVISSAFTVSGVILTFLQWQLPPSSGTGHSEPKRSGKHPVLPLPGSLLVKAKRPYCGATVHLSCGFDPAPQQAEHAANITEQWTPTGPEFLAEFPALEPGNYTVYIEPNGPLARVTVPGGRMTEIDWRYIPIKNRRGSHEQAGFSSPQSPGQTQGGDNIHGA